MFLPGTYVGNLGNTNYLDLPRGLSDAQSWHAGDPHYNSYTVLIEKGKVLKVISTYHYDVHMHPNTSKVKKYFHVSFAINQNMVDLQSQNEARFLRSIKC